MIKYLTKNEETIETLIIIISIHAKIYPEIQYKFEKWCDCIKQISMYLLTCMFNVYVK